MRWQFMKRRIGEGPEHLRAPGIECSPMVCVQDEAKPALDKLVFAIGFE